MDKVYTILEGLPRTHVVKDNKVVIDGVSYSGKNESELIKSLEKIDFYTDPAHVHKLSSRILINSAKSKADKVWDQHAERLIKLNEWYDKCREEK